MSVEEVYNKHPSSLYWGYCCKEEINFNEEVLQKLESKFTMFKRIEKPGVDKEQFEKIMNNNWGNKSYSELNSMVTAKRINGEIIPTSLMEQLKKKRFEKKTKMYCRIIESKSVLQGRNHGRV
jgi:Ca2+-binding EF-hand superfamily protein